MLTPLVVRTLTIWAAQGRSRTQGNLTSVSPSRNLVNLSWSSSVRYDSVQRRACVRRNSRAAPGILRRCYRIRDLQAPTQFLGIPGSRYPPQNKYRMSLPGDVVSSSSFLPRKYYSKVLKKTLTSGIWAPTTRIPRRELPTPNVRLSRGVSTR